MAASGWCAPSSDMGGLGALRTSWWVGRPMKYPDRVLNPPSDYLACGCSVNMLETGWHETGCEIVGDHLCRAVTKPQRAARHYPAVEYSA